MNAAIAKNDKDEEFYKRRSDLFVDMLNYEVFNKIFH